MFVQQKKNVLTSFMKRSAIATMSAAGALSASLMTRDPSACHNSDTFGAGHIHGINVVADIYEYNCILSLQSSDLDFDDVSSSANVREMELIHDFDVQRVAAVDIQGDRDQVDLRVVMILLAVVATLAFCASLSTCSANLSDCVVGLAPEQVVCILRQFEAVQVMCGVHGRRRCAAYSSSQRTRTTDDWANKHNLDVPIEPREAVRVERCFPGMARKTFSETLSQIKFLIYVSDRAACGAPHVAEQGGRLYCSALAAPRRRRGADEKGAGTAAHLQQGGRRQAGQRQARRGQARQRTAHGERGHTPLPVQDRGAEQRGQGGRVRDARQCWLLFICSLCLCIR